MKAESSAAAAAIALSSVKDSRRRQYRSCDRCRVGKRACNAEYDSVAEAINNKVACSNCRKKGKSCSFQYVLSILGGVPSTSGDGVVASGDMPMMPGLSTFVEQPMVYDSVNSTFQTLNDLGSSAAQTDTIDSTSAFAETRQASSLRTVARSGVKQDEQPSRAMIHAVTVAEAASAFKSLSSISPTSSTTRMTSTIDRIFLNDGLIRVYEGAAEHALQCWVSSSNTPYMLSQSSSISTSSSQQLVYWRICELDRGARTLLSLPPFGPASREREIMEAFHSVVLAFAAQWSPHRVSNLAQPQSKCSENKVRLALWERARDKLQKVANVDSFRVIFALIIFAWTEKPRQVMDCVENGIDVDLNAENCALDTSAWQSPAEGSTFLLVAAMRKLLSIKFRIEGKKRRGVCPWNAPNRKAAGAATSSSGAASQARAQQSASAMELDGEEQIGATMAGKIQADLENKQPATAAHGRSRPSYDPDLANAAETSRMEGTYHMLYWLCVVIDTETSVLRKYPPVVCDEDSEVMSSIPSLPPSTLSGRKGIWDDYILDMSKLKQHTEFTTSWPCDISKASATLAFSTPVKVVMFRQIGRLQMSFWRRASTTSVEQQIRSGLSIIYHWNQVYGPLIDSCRASHAELPVSIQSWYVLLAFPWYLAVLLFVEMVQTVDMAGASDRQARYERARSGIFPRLRDRACSDLALLIAAIQSTSFDHLEPTFEYVRDSGGNLLLTEPWSEILVHSITAVVKTEVKLHEGYCSSFKWRELEESHDRIGKCLWALDKLSDRSPSAQMAYEQLERLTRATKSGTLAFQQIPLASPPLQREALAEAQCGRMTGIGGGPSPVSDVDSLRLGSIFEGSIESVDRFSLAIDIDGSALDRQQPSLQSAFDTYFALDASSHVASTPQDAATARSDDAIAQCSYSHSSKTDQAGQATDYLQLLRTLEQPDCDQSSAAPLTTGPNTASLSIEPLSILQTLAQLTNQPMREMLSLGSDTSTSSADTSFSINSAVRFARDWKVDVNSVPVFPSAAGGSEHMPTNLTSAQTSERTSDSDSDSSDDSIARKKHKVNHPAHLDTMMGFACDQQPLSFNLYPTSLTGAAPLEHKFMSVPLQAPAWFDRKHDDLYTDEDDDDLVSYRATLLKRRHSVDDTCRSAGADGFEVLEETGGAANDAISAMPFRRALS
ncbi:Zn(2)-C6 fungal-type domain-containing protein [Pseudozyma hubeiensis]|nr:Zn(2)-C6 fungal-type domain-containing protein [Pseudozyma hubeiensis]